jgi:hypothetical protein
MFNIYCDESCHLPNDNSDVMVLGAIKCEDSRKKEIYQEIREIKQKHGISTWAELKWTKVSRSKQDLYKELIDYFFCNTNLSFRCVIAPGKRTLDHERFNNGNYDEWYYKMYYQLLLPLVAKDINTRDTNLQNYRVFIDIKDTLGGPKIKKLHEILIQGIKKEDLPGLTNKEFINGVYQINSLESELLQLADLLIGIVTFYCRGLYFIDKSSKGKRDLVKYALTKHKLTLYRSTNRNEEKFNIFVWQQQGGKYEYK